MNERTVEMMRVIEKPAKQSKKVWIYLWTLGALCLFGALAFVTVLVQRPIDVALFGAIISPIMTLGLGSGMAIAWHDKGVRAKALESSTAPEAPGGGA